MTTPIGPNDIGLTAIGGYDSGLHTTALRQQLDTAGVAYETVQLPQIVGMGGNAALLSYLSPNTAQPVTVLIVPVRVDIDTFGEDYFYFAGLTLNDAMAGDVEGRWAVIYDRCMVLFAEAQQPWLPVSRVLAPADVVVGAVVIEPINGVRHRIAAIDGAAVHVVPIDNPVPVPRGNARGRTPTGWHVANLCATHRLLTDSQLASLDTATYAARFGLGNNRIQWLPYEEAGRSDAG